MSILENVFWMRVYIFKVKMINYFNVWGDFEFIMEVKDCGWRVGG